MRLIEPKRGSGPKTFSDHVHQVLRHLAHPLVLGHSPFTAVFNVSGCPAMSMPLAHDTGRGLPIGLQFGAGYGREDLLLQLAGQLERALPWQSRRPPVWAGSVVQTGRQ